MARLKNPLYKGYSPDIIGRNISEALSKGVSHAQAIGIALTTARREYRLKHPTGPFPRHLKMVGKVRRKNPISEKTAHKLRKAAPKTFQYMTDEEIKRGVKVKKKRKKRVVGKTSNFKPRQKRTVDEQLASIERMLQKFPKGTYGHKRALEMKKSLRRKNPVSPVSKDYQAGYLHGEYGARSIPDQYDDVTAYLKGYAAGRKRYLKPSKKRVRKNPVSTLIKVFKHGPGEKKFQQVGYFTGTGWDTSISKAEKYSAGAARKLAAQLKIPAGWGLALVTG